VKENIFETENNIRNKYQSNTNYCPSNKKDCKCWICQEDGHKAYECPKKTKKEKETNLLKIAYDLGYEPIEDSGIDSDIDIYAYTTDTDSDSGK
jgi:predicted transcriptional regulator